MKKKNPALFNPSNTFKKTSSTYQVWPYLMLLDQNLAIFIHFLLCKNHIIILIEILWGFEIHTSIAISPLEKKSLARRYLAKECPCVEAKPADLSCLFIWRVILASQITESVRLSHCTTENPHCTWEKEVESAEFQSISRCYLTFLTVCVHKKYSMKAGSIPHPICGTQTHFKSSNI